MKITWIHGIKALRGASMSKWVHSLLSAIGDELPRLAMQIHVDELKGVSVPVLKGICNRYVLYSLHALRLKADLFHIHDHANAHLVPLLPGGCPKIVTVHDLYPLTRPLYEATSYPFRVLNVPGIRKADRIVSVSQHMKDEISKRLGFPRERISVVYCGIDHSLFRPTPRVEVLHERYGLDYGERYLLYVGSEIPRKNFSAVLRVFQKLSTRYEGLRLLKVGNPGSSAARKATLGEIERLAISDRVVFCGFVPENELPVFYSCATALLAPSFYEGGSGMHVIEAMACGCPVIASGIPQARELAGGAALHCDPHDDDDILEKAQALLEDEGLRSRMISKGLERAAEFSWRKAALTHLDIYREFS